jgi:hypothetical protein
LIFSDGTKSLSESVARSPQALEQVIKVVNHTHRFDGSACIGNLAIRSERVHVWHRPDGLIPRTRIGWATVYTPSRIL